MKMPDMKLVWWMTDEPCVKGFVYVEREHPTIEGAIERKVMSKRTFELTEEK
tara:strand:+ start:491 stop:646 length:156 start_codon:yes stop_codon:yes gene_type:complete